MKEKEPTGSSFLNPDKILKDIGVTTGDKVADLGCGAGYFVLEAAKLVGDKGVVYGVDVKKNILSSLVTKARMFGYSNVEVVWSNVEVFNGAKVIANDSIDYIILAQILHQSKNHHAIIKESVRMLKKGGQLIVVDWKNDKLSFGPTAEDRVNPEALQKIAAEEGLNFTKEIEVGPYHYSLIFNK